jgi:glycosyltransferase involved in cell wall biosynthesis
MKSTESLISVVVPVYMVEKYLSRCIDSILGQTYNNFEIILINDGSRDDSPKICNKYASIYENISVIHQKNAGLSAARNSGINAAKGKYITFIDSDDYIHEKLLEILYSYVCNYNVPVSMCSYLRVNDTVDRRKMPLISENNILNVLDDKEAMDMLLEEQTTCVAWGKLYELELFNDVRFPDGKIMEDMFTTPKIFKKSKRVAVSNQQLYFYNQEGDSITRSDFNLKKIDMIEATYFWKEFTEKYYPSLSEKAYVHYLITVVNMCQLLVKSNDEEVKLLYENYTTEILKNFKYIIDSAYVRRNDKVKVILMKIKLFKTIYR